MSGSFFNLAIWNPKSAIRNPKSGWGTEDFLIEALVLRDDLRGAEPGRGRLSGTLPHLPAQAIVAENLQCAARHCVDIARLHEKAFHSLCHDFREASNPGHYYRHLAGHGFERDQSERFVIAGQQ